MRVSFLGGKSGTCAEVQLIRCLHGSTSPGRKVLRATLGHRWDMRGTLREIRGQVRELHGNRRDIHRNTRNHNRDPSWLACARARQDGDGLVRDQDAIFLLDHQGLALQPVGATLQPRPAVFPVGDEKRGASVGSFTVPMVSLVKIMSAW